MLEQLDDKSLASRTAVDIRNPTALQSGHVLVMRLWLDQDFLVLSFGPWATTKVPKRCCV
jgi:hypothetical protein